MKIKIVKLLILIFILTFGFYTIHTFALYRNSKSSSGSIETATWSVTRSQSQSGDSIDVVVGGDTDTYTLTVQSNSEVDVKYKIIISNLPTGIEVDLDNTGYLTPSNGSLTIQNNNTVINYNDVSKTKTHTLTFRAVSGATEVLNREIDIDVEFIQIV